MVSLGFKMNIECYVMRREIRIFYLYERSAKIFLSDTTKNHLKEWFKNQKWLNNIFKSDLSQLQFILFFHVYPLHAKIYDLKCLVEF